ncbi:MAG: GntR family transcriptional regulator [Erysipelotrichaceae bacterium]
MDYRIPLYLQIKDMIIQKIENREFLPGEKIPSERKMAELYGVNRMTIKAAINGLVEDGYLYGEQGVGTFVTTGSNKFEWGLPTFSDNEGMSATFEETGIHLKNKLLFASKIKANNFLGMKLNISPNEDVYSIQRVRYTDDDIYAVEYAYVPMKFFSDIEVNNFEHVSLYGYMNSKDHLPIKFKRNLIIMNPRDKEAKYLKIDKNVPVYYFEYIGKDAMGNVVEYTESFFKTDKLIFKFNIHSEDNC